MLQMRLFQMLRLISNQYLKGQTILSVTSYTGPRVPPSFVGNLLIKLQRVFCRYLIMPMALLSLQLSLNRKQWDTNRPETDAHKYM